MTETAKTQNYQLSIFDDTQTTLTFKEFRELLAGNGATTADFSNMQKIDSLLKKCETDIAAAILEAKGYTDDLEATMASVNSGNSTVDGISVNFIRVDDYALKHKTIDNKKHLRLVYSPKTGGES